MTIAAAARRLLRQARQAALSTTLAAADGWPYASLVTIACDLDASPILLLSDIADHTRNLARDPRACLLIEAASRLKNPQTGPRLSVLGRIARAEEPRLERRFLARHPDAALYAGFADFHIYRLTATRGHFVGGFARAHWLEGDTLRCDAQAAAALAAAEEEMIAHLNTDHAATIDLYANRLLGHTGSGWQVSAIDPDGCDLRRGDALIRLDFPRTAAAPAAVREILLELAHRARAGDAADGSQ